MDRRGKEEVESKEEGKASRAREPRCSHCLANTSLRLPDGRFGNFQQYRESLQRWQKADQEFLLCSQILQNHRAHLPCVFEMIEGFQADISSTLSFLLGQAHCNCRGEEILGLNTAHLAARCRILTNRNNEVPVGPPPPYREEYKSSSSSSSSSSNKRARVAFCVEAILAHVKEEDGSYNYFVKWEGYPRSENSWLSEDQFFDGPLIRSYKQYHNLY